MFQTKVKPMDDRVMHVVMLMDASQSMQERRASTIAGINAYVEELVARPEITEQDSFECWLFNGDRGLWCAQSPRPLKNLGEFDGKGYVCQGMTPLRDSVYDLLDRQRERLTGNHQVLLVVMTDGKENASRQRSALALNDLINRLRRTGLLTTTFLGCDIKAWGVMEHSGLDQTQNRDATFSYASAHTVPVFREMAHRTAGLKGAGGASMAFWKDENAVAKALTLPDDDPASFAGSPSPVPRTKPNTWSVG